MEITIPFKTPTINKAYWHHGNIKMITKPARVCREKIIDIVYLSEYKLEDYQDKKLIVDITIYENWYFKNGNVRLADVANREKFLIDSIFNGLGINDKYIWKLTIRKVQSDEEKAVVKIEVMDDSQI